MFVKKKKFLPIILAFILLLSVLAACQNFAEGVSLDARIYKPHKDSRMYADAPNYDGFYFKHGDDLMTFRFKTSKNYRENPNTEEKSPLVIFLHGKGDGGTDNVSHMYKAVINSLDEYGYADDCFVLMPQAHKKQDWTDDGASAIFNALLEDHILENYPIDMDRIYLLGKSLGGGGTFFQLDKNPERYAAAMPICPYIPIDMFDNVAKVPMWIGHSKDDKVVDFSMAQNAYDEILRIRTERGETDIENVLKYTWFEDKGHLISSDFYCRPEVWDWLFSHRKTASA